MKTDIPICKNCGALGIEYFSVRNSPRLQNVLCDDQQKALFAERMNCDFYICPHCGLLFNNLFF